MSSITLNKPLSDSRGWSEDLDEEGRWSRRKSLLFMGMASVAFWSALAFVLAQ